MIVTDPLIVDALWFAVHRVDTHRIRPATDEEDAAFDIMKPGFENLMTMVRRLDGARATYGFKPGDDIMRACDFELARWFDADLGRA